MSYRVPRYQGPLVITNQWDNIISEFDYPNRLFKIKLSSYTLNSHDNTMRMFENIFQASLTDIPEIKVEIEFESCPIKSAKLLRQFINKVELIGKLDNIIESDKLRKKLSGQRYRFLNNTNPKKRLEKYLMSSKYFPVREMLNLPLDNFKMIDSFITLDQYFSTYNLGSELKNKNIMDRLEKINYFFDRLDDEKVKKDLLFSKEIKEALATYKLKDII